MEDSIKYPICPGLHYPDRNGDFAGRKICRSWCTYRKDGFLLAEKQRQISRMGIKKGNFIYIGGFYDNGIYFKPAITEEEQKTMENEMQKKDPFLKRIKKDWRKIVWLDKQCVKSQFITIIFAGVLFTLYIILVDALITKIFSWVL